MSYSVKKTTITLTRGDTFKTQVDLRDSEGNPYVLGEYDFIQFAVKKDYSDENYQILKLVDPTTMVLTLTPEDTRNMDYGEYVYDMQLTKGNGEVATFITKARFVLTEEVCGE